MTLLAAGLAIWAGGIPRAHAYPTYFWVGKGSTDAMLETNRYAVTPAFSLAGAFTDSDIPPTALGPTYYSNWFVYTDGTSDSGALLPAAGNPFSGVVNLTFCNPSAYRLMVDIDSGVPRTVSIGTLTDVTMSNMNLDGPGSGLDIATSFSRWPDAAGTHDINVQRIACSTYWIAGGGDTTLRGWLMRHPSTALGSPITKSGNGTLVIDPSPAVYALAAPFATTPAGVISPINIYDGTVVLKNSGGSTGASPLFARSTIGNVLSPSEAVRVGAAFGGLDTPPGTGNAFRPFSVPIPSYDLNAPKRPVLAIRGPNTIPADMSVRVASGGLIRFEYGVGDPIFAAPIVSDTVGAGVVECSPGNFGNRITFTDTVLAGFTGALSVTSGRLVVASLPMAPSIITIGSGGELEVNVASGTSTVGRTIAGSGKLFKTGAGELHIADPNYPGSQVGFEIREGLASIDGITFSPASIAASGGELRLSTASTRLSPSSRRVEAYGNVGLARITGPGAIVVGADGVTIRNSRPDASAAFVNNTIVGTSTLDISAPFTDGPISIVSGAGPTRFHGNSVIPGPITVQGGWLQLQRPTTTVQPVVVTLASPGPSSGSLLQTLASEQLSNSDPIIIEHNCVLDVHGKTETVGSVISRGNSTIHTFADGVDGSLQVLGDLSYALQEPTTPATPIFEGSLNLRGGTRNLVISQGVSLSMNGRIDTGILRVIGGAAGGGALTLGPLQGTSILRLDMSNVGTSSAVTLGGLAGTRALNIADTLTLNTSAGVNGGYGGAITGSGSLVKSGSGVQELNDGAANTYTGGTRVEGGTLFLNRFPGTTVIPGNITIASGGTLLYAGGATNQIADTSDVTIEPGGVMDLAGQTDTVRNLTIQGLCRTDTTNGASLGSVSATQTILVAAGGTLDGGVGGGALNVIATGRARVRGTVASAALGLTGATLAVGGFPGSDQLTINGVFSTFNPNAVIECTLGTSTDPALIRALGSLSYPPAGTVTMRVIQNTPAPFGTSYRLVDFGTGTSVPNLAKYAVASAPGSGQGRLALNNRVLSYVVSRNPCASDADGNGARNIDDIFVYLSLWFAGSPGADFDLSGARTIDDIFIFLNAWFAGC